jgi:large subunit ribosomal protein L1
MSEAKKPSKKEELLKEAKKLKLSVTAKNTIAQIEDAIAEAKASAATSKKVAELVETESIAEEIVKVEKELDDEDKATAKAGKRSAKAIKEAEEKAAKEARKAEDHEALEHKPKLIPKTRPKLERQGKKFRKAAEQIDKTKVYSLKEAVSLATKTSTTKFDSSVELHVRLGVDPRQADQNIRSTIVLPEGNGKEVKVAVFAEEDDVAIAKKAGADIAGNQDFLNQLEKGLLNFDVLVATPSMMPKLGKYAKVLGPKGLMPSPKSGTVTTAVEKAVKEAKAGKVEYRVDSTGIVHLSVGKVSFGEERLSKNVKAVLSSIRSNKPNSLKGNFVLSIYLTTTMGPSIKVQNSEL